MRSFQVQLKIKENSRRGSRFVWRGETYILGYLTERPTFYKKGKGKKGVYQQ
jgi:hypothetical protein